jgi:hypothetical protein
VLSTAYAYKKKRITRDISKTALQGLTSNADGSGCIDFAVSNQLKLIIAGCCLGFLIIATAYFTNYIDTPPVYNFGELKKVTTFKREPHKIFTLTNQSLKQKKIPKAINKSTALHKSEIATGLKFSPAQKAATKANLTPKMTHSVQAGAFLIKKNAENVSSILRRKGYDARIVEFKDSKKRVWYTVRIGDYPSREIAKKHANAFTSKEKRESAIVPIDNL